MIVLQEVYLDKVAGGFQLGDTENWRTYDSFGGVTGYGEPFTATWQGYLAWLEENPGMTYADFTGV